MQARPSRPNLYGSQTGLNVSLCVKSFCLNIIFTLLTNHLFFNIIMCPLLFTENLCTCIYLRVILLVSLTKCLLFQNVLSMSLLFACKFTISEMSPDSN